MTKHDNFLADAVKPPHSKHIGYFDGFRFGLGFFVSGLLVAVVLGALTWAVMYAMQAH
jgi:hypothetical protein